MEVDARARCDASGLPLLAAPASYLFPCAHAFIADALVAAVVPHLASRARARVGEVLALLARGRRAGGALERDGAAALPDVGSDVAALLSLPPPAVAAFSVGEARAGVAMRCAGLQAELDGLVAAQCPLCGDAMVELVSTPLDAEMGPGEWEL